jgi:hypothetical protein
MTIEHMPLSDILKLLDIHEARANNEEKFPIRMTTAQMIVLRTTT